MSELNALFPSAAASLAALVEAGLVRSVKTERLRAPHEYVEVTRSLRSSRPTSSASSTR